MESNSSHKLIKTILIVLIIILLIIAVAIITIGITSPSTLYNVPVVGSLMQAINPSNEDMDEDEDYEDEDEENDEEETDVDEDETESEEPEEKENEDEDVINVSLNEEDENIIPYDEEIEELLLNYSVGINRLDGNIDNYENNTVLLFIANRFFESQTTASIDIDSKYAATKDNIHKYLTELTTKDYTEIDHLDSYSNIIRYVKKSNSYAIGSDVSLLNREKYSLADLEYNDNGDGTYSGSAVVLRSIEMEDGTRERTNYSINFKFSLNKRFTYSKYKILSFSAANKDFFPDNTYHLEKN